MIVAVCANAAVDLTYTMPEMVPGEVHRVEDVRARAGGKGVNVARVLHQLGQPVLLCGFAGGGTGTAIAADLAASGIDARLTAIRGESRRSVSVVAAGQATVFNESGPTVTDDEWRALVADVDQACAGASVAVLSGSLPPGAPPDGYGELTRLARRRGALVIVDADGAALAGCLPAAPDVAKPNAAEVGAWLDRPVRTRADAAEAGRLLLRAGAHAVIISRGADGLVSVRDAEAVEARLATPVTGNPTGAGDALAAVIARGLAVGATWRELLCDGVAVAAAAVAEPVAGGFVRSLAERLRPRVDLEEF